MAFPVGLEGIHDYERNLREICDYALSHGIKSRKSINPLTCSKEDYNKFIAKCHEGFDLAQDMIVNQFLEIQGEKRNYGVELKDARRKKDKTTAYLCEANIVYLTNRELILRKVADAIAWQMWGLQRWNLRRLYLGKQMPYLDSANIDSIISATKEINKEPLSFGLIADITSFIQIGDILAVDRSKESAEIHLIEMKAGEMNLKVMEFLESFDKIQCPRIPYFFAQEHGKAALEQALRVTKQQMKAAQVMQIVKTGKGKDPYFDRDIVIPDEIFEEDDYDETLARLIEKCRINGAACDVVDDCLFLGVYDPSKYPRYLSDFTNYLYFNLTGIKRDPFMYSEEFYENELFLFLEKAYPIYDLRLSLTIPLSKPLFLRLLPKEDIFNIIFGKVIILLYLDYERLFERAKDKGIVGKWSTEEARKEHGVKDFYSKLGKRPMFEKEGKVNMMGDGSLSRIIDGTKPDSVLELVEHSLSRINWDKTP